MVKKRIAIVLTGGIESGVNGEGIPALSQLIAGLAKSFEIDIFSFTPVNPNLKSSDYRLFSIGSQTSKPGLFKFLKILFLLFKEHRKNKYRIFHGIWAYPSGFTSVFFSKIVGEKSIVSLIGGGVASIKEINYGNRATFLRRSIVDWTLKYADQVTALSYYQKKWIPFEPVKNKLKVIPFGVDVKQFYPAEKRITNPVQFIHIANLTLVKDQYTLLKCFEILVRKINCQLMIIGFDAFEGQIQKLAMDLEIDPYIEFIGFLDHREVAKRLRNSDLLIHTSLYEAEAVVVPEAMASGVLVCGTDVGIISDLAPDCCLAVPVGEYSLLAEKIFRLMANVKAQEMMRKNALSWVSAHPMTWTIREYSNLYHLI